MRRDADRATAEFNEGMARMTAELLRAEFDLDAPAVCEDEDGTYADHDWSEWIDRPDGIEPASKPHHAVRLRYCSRCNRYEGQSLGGVTRRCLITRSAR